MDPYLCLPSEFVGSVISPQKTLRQEVDSKDVREWELEEEGKRVSKSCAWVSYCRDNWGPCETPPPTRKLKYLPIFSALYLLELFLGYMLLDTFAHKTQVKFCPP